MTLVSWLLVTLACLLSSAQVFLLLFDWLWRKLRGVEPK